PVSIFLPKLYVTKNFQNQPTRMIRPAMPAHINKVIPIADGAMPAHSRIPELPAFQPNKSGRQNSVLRLRQGAPTQTVQAVRQVGATQHQGFCQPRQEALCLSAAASAAERHYARFADGGSPVRLWTAARACLDQRAKRRPAAWSAWPAWNMARQLAAAEKEYGPEHPARSDLRRGIGVYRRHGRECGHACGPLRPAAQHAT
ncbi:hypothetical protein, partial [Chromobacterium violaceum]|uniref:hypothetical protein n=1 Tax=Chromobacterium violaceum TaxID=536 RepID=UPI001C8B5C74